MIKIHKYRAWDKEKKKMILDMQKAGLVLIPTAPDWALAQSNPVKGDNVYDDYLYSWSDADVMTGRYEPIEFTGLLDKNKKEIYDKDIIEVTISGLNGKFQMVWHDNGFWLDYGDNCWELPFQEHRKIIGNVFENPELIP